jgi:hypothetical protein
VSCTDSIANGHETAVDCGGGTCTGCDDGEMCLLDRDCSSEICDPGTKTCTSCRDAIRNGAESDVDCGQVCPDRCDDGERCITKMDCKSVQCTLGGGSGGDVGASSAGVCTSCFNVIKDGYETDVDCGGNFCKKRCA